VGIYLSAHPLDEYRVVIDNLCNAHCPELADRAAALMDREEVTLGGIVTSVQTRFGKNNNPWGIVTLEDFYGAGELLLFGEDWRALNGQFIEGAAVFVKGRIQSRFYNSDQKELKVTSVELLQTVKEKQLERITIALNTDHLDNQIVADLNEIINESPGRTELFFQLSDSTGKHRVLLRSQKNRIDVRHQLIDFIAQHEGLEYHIN
jgi:DNA polymerase-3 subunit alpha